MHAEYIKTLRIAAPSKEAAARARVRWDAVAKPTGSLGLLEDAVVQIAALTGSDDIELGRRAMVVFCADNGVLAQGVASNGAQVTRLVAHNVAAGTSSVNRMCEAARIDCIAVDMGMLEPENAPGLLDRRIAAGTCDMSQGPAMTRAQAAEAIRSGAELVGELAERGYRVVCTGEVGMGNTTTATAVACALTGADPKEYTGRGAGLSDEGLARKVAVIEQSLAVNAPDRDDALDVLAKVGGFDIAAMCGAFLGAAAHRVPIIVDGVISMAAALCASRLRPECRAAMLASHLSAEPMASLLASELGLEPIVHAGMRLGEGSGAACAVPLLDMALSVYNSASTFAGSGITTYAAPQCK